MEYNIESTLQSISRWERVVLNNIASSATLTEMRDKLCGTNTWQVIWTLDDHHKRREEKWQGTYQVFGSFEVGGVI